MTKFIVSKRRKNPIRRNGKKYQYIGSYTNKRNAVSDRNYMAKQSKKRKSSIAGKKISRRIIKTKKGYHLYTQTLTDKQRKERFS